MPWIVQRQIVTTLIGLPQRYINSTVTNVTHLWWRGNWLSPVPLPSLKIKCDFSIADFTVSQKICTNNDLCGRYVTGWARLTYSVYELEGLLLRGLTSETEKDRKGKENKVGKQRSGYVGWSRLHVDMRKNMENLFLRKLYGLTCEVRSPDPFLQSVDVLSC